MQYEKWRGFAVVVVLGGLWELIEQYILHTRVVEANTNSIMDVVCAAVGYLAGYWLLHSELSDRDKKIVGFLAAAAFVIVNALRVLGA